MVMGVRFNSLLAVTLLVLNTIVSEGVEVIIPASPNIMKALIRLELRIGLELEMMAVDGVPKGNYVPSLSVKVLSSFSTADMYFN